MATATPHDQHGGSEKTLVCEVLKSVLSDIGAPECLKNFTDDGVDDAIIAHLAENRRLKPSKWAQYGLPEDKCAAFIEKFREKLVAQTSSSFGAAQRGLPSRLPPLQPALGTSLHSDQTDYVAAASDVSTSSQPAGDTSPLSPLSSSSPVPSLAFISPVDAANLLRGLNLEVLEELGKGGFGTVFKCEDRTQKRRVAVKLVNDNPEHAKQARREGQKLLRAKHDYIVGMYKVHPNDDKSAWCALEMELVSGGDLSQLLEAHRRSERPLPPEAVLRFSRQLLEAIVYVHDVLDWLHGDIKPQNILLSNPLSAGRSLEDYSSATIKLADFGEAKVMNQQNSKESWMNLTNATSTLVDGKLKGTLWYLSPEALQGASRGYERAKTDDLWSACLVILEMDTGLTLQQLMTAPGSVNIAKLLENTSKELLPLLYSVLVKPAASRCKHASELLSMLDASKNPLFIWQLYDDAKKTYVDVHPASSVVLENAFVANHKKTNLPEALGAPLDLHFDIEEIIAKSEGLGWQHRKSSGEKCRIRRLLNAQMLNSNESIPIWQKLVDGKKWEQCSPADCAKLDIDAKKACVNPLHYRRLKLEPAHIGEVQLPHPLKNKPYLVPVPAQDADFEMMTKRVQDSLKEWKITKMEQVVNSTLASKYADYRHRVAARCNGNPKERMLFHFCSPFVIEKIWKEGEGHDPRLSNWAEVGKGAYFSEHAMYGYAYTCSLWPGPPDYEVKPEPPIGHTMQAFASLVCLGNVADVGPGCETCPSPAWDAWKKEPPVMPKPTRPPAITLPSDPAERLHILDLVQNDTPRCDSVKSTEGNFDTHPHSKNSVSVKRLGYRRRVRDIMHPRLHDRAKEWAEQYVLFDVAASYPMFILTLTKHQDSPFGPQQLLDAGCEVSLVKQIGFDASHFKALGKTASEMLIAGWSVPDLKSAGFDASSLLAGGCDKTELTSAGFTTPQLNEAVADNNSKTNKSSESAAAADALHARIAMKSVRDALAALQSLGASDANTLEEAQVFQEIGGGVGISDMLKSIRIRVAAGDLIRALQHPLMAGNVARLRSEMKVKEGYLIAAGFKSSTVAAVQDSTDCNVNIDTSSRDVINSPPATVPTAAENFKLKCSAMLEELLHYQFSVQFVYSFDSLYRHRQKMLYPALILALISATVGLVLGDIISILILVVCLPTMFAFLAHWTSVITDTASYPVKWYVGFASYLVLAFSASLGSMLSDAAKITNAVGQLTYRNQAGIMIPFFFGLLFIVSALFYDGVMKRKKTKEKRTVSDSVCAWILLVALLSAVFLIWTIVTGHISPNKQYVFYNGYVYATAHLNYYGLVGWGNAGDTSFVEILKGFEIAPGTSDDVSICAAYPWDISYLIFSDGSACGTTSLYARAENMAENWRLQHIGFAIKLIVSVLPPTVVNFLTAETGTRWFYSENNRFFSFLKQQGTMVGLVYPNHDVMLRKRA